MFAATSRARRRVERNSGPNAVRLQPAVPQNEGIQCDVLRALARKCPISDNLPFSALHLVNLLRSRSATCLRARELLAANGQLMDLLQAGGDANYNIWAWLDAALRPLGTQLAKECPTFMFHCCAPSEEILEPTQRLATDGSDSACNFRHRGWSCAQQRQGLPFAFDGEKIPDAASLREWPSDCTPEKRARRQATVETRRSPLAQDILSRLARQDDPTANLLGSAMEPEMRTSMREVYEEASRAQAPISDSSACDPMQNFDVWQAYSRVHDGLPLRTLARDMGNLCPHLLRESFERFPYVRDQVIKIDDNSEIGGVLHLEKLPGLQPDPERVQAVRARFAAFPLCAQESYAAFAANLAKHMAEFLQQRDFEVLQYFYRFNDSLENALKAGVLLEALTGKNYNMNDLFKRLQLFCKTGVRNATEPAERRVNSAPASGAANVSVHVVGDPARIEEALTVLASPCLSGRSALLRYLRHEFPQHDAIWC